MDTAHVDETLATTRAVRPRLDLERPVGNQLLLDCMYLAEQAGDLRLEVYTGPLRHLDNGGQFSPTTSTLVFGPTAAVLVDTQYMADEPTDRRRRPQTPGSR